MIEENVPAIAEMPSFNILGVKISYNKAFGVMFLVIFLLLFFPGIGISSSGVENMVEEQSNKE